MHDGLRRVLDPRWMMNEEQEILTSFCVNAGEQIWHLVHLFSCVPQGFEWVLREMDICKERALYAC